MQADGKILVSGSFTTLYGQPRNSIGRLNADGTLDTSFDPEADDVVSSIAVQSDGQILLGGFFSTLQDQPRHFIGRISNTEPAAQTLTADTATITWLRSGTSPEISNVTFDFCTNGMDWITLGAGEHIPGGWQLSGSRSRRKPQSAPVALLPAGFTTDQHGSWKQCFARQAPGGPPSPNRRKVNPF